MKVRLTATVFALAFVAAGVFFATRGSLSDADQLASVGSFLLALGTLGSTAVIAARSRTTERTEVRRDEGTSKPRADRARSSTVGHPDDTAPEPGTDRPATHYGSRISIGSIEGVENMSVGDHTTTRVYNDYSADRTRGSD
jgi:hypothetical protein